MATDVMVAGDRYDEEDPALPWSLADAEALGEQVLKALGLVDAELSVVLCDDGFIAPLNAEWRGKDEPTDVLSFPQWECETPGQLPDDAEPPYVLGDVVISLDTAARQADALGHALADELVVLFVHGVCHLLGWDHEDDEDAAEMRAQEGRVLAMVRPDLAARGLVERGAERG